MSAVSNYISYLAPTVKTCCEEIMLKAEELSPTGKSIGVGEQLRKLDALHTAVERDHIDPQEVLSSASELIGSMKGNQLFKIQKLPQRLADILLASDNGQQKVQNLFKLADEMLANVRRCFPNRQVSTATASAS